RLLFVILLASVDVVVPRAQQPVFRAGTELVLVNVVVRDKSGAVVRGLKADDFTITEDDKPQAITSFDFEELDRADAAASAAAEPAPVLPEKPVVRAGDSAAPAPAPAKVDMRGRRLIVLFFDLSSMQPEELN